MSEDEILDMARKNPRGTVSMQVHAEPVTHSYRVPLGFGLTLPAECTRWVVHNSGDLQAVERLVRRGLLREIGRQELLHLSPEPADERAKRKGHRVIVHRLDWQLIDAAIAKADPTP
jgi:hypothetical protein